MKIRTMPEMFTVALAALALVPGAATAQTYPTKPIRMIVPFPAGGGVDYIGRIVAKGMSDRLGQQVLVDNRPGANAIVGLEVLKAAPPDGYTIAAASAGPLAVNPFIYKKLPHDTLKDFTQIASMCNFPLMLVAHPSLPVKSVKEFIALARARPGQLDFASSGVGTASHLSAEYFKTEARLNLVHVPYKGTGNAMADLLAGQVVLMFDQPVSSLPYVQAGKLKVLGITSGKRFPTLRDIPTVAEQGLPGFEAISWSGVCAPGGTPRAIVDRIQAEVARVLKVPDIRDRLLRDGIEPVGGTPDEFLAHTRREAEKWRKVIRDANVKIE